MGFPIRVREKLQGEKAAGGMQSLFWAYWQTGPFLYTKNSVSLQPRRLDCIADLTVIVEGGEQDLSLVATCKQEDSLTLRKKAMRLYYSVFSRETEPMGYYLSIYLVIYLPTYLPTYLFTIGTGSQSYGGY